MTPHSDDIPPLLSQEGLCRLRRMNSSPLEPRIRPGVGEDFIVDLEGNLLPKLEELSVITCPGSATKGRSDLGLLHV